MKIKLLLISFILAANALGAVAQVSKTYFVSKPGTLISMMTEDEANSITHLTLTGKINAEDFRHLRDEFPNLKVLDISNADIKMYTGKAGTYPNGKLCVYMPNFIPTYAFSNIVDGVTKGKATLEKIILSEKIKNIEDAAFKGCENLKICQIRKKTAPNLLPEALADSITAIFVPLGSSDEYRYKNRWEKFAFIEGEPVETTLQVGAMGKLEEEILKPYRREEAKEKRAEEKKIEEKEAAEKTAESEAKRALKPYASDCGSRKNLPFSVSCEDKQTALSLYKREGIKRMYLPFDAMEACLEGGLDRGVEMYLSLPHIMRGEMPEKFLSTAREWLGRGMKSFLVRNLEWS